MSFTKIAIVAGALVSFATAASADFRYTGSPKQGQFYVQNSMRDARAEVLPSDAKAAPTTQVRKGGISARGI
ncbi:MAG: hypothetical protein HY242_11680 [Afipia sp.]|nr:hypothetical protein [Afipia sp.]